MNRYETIKRIMKNRNTYYGTSDLPKVKRKDDDILLIATSGDRCDLIANQIYGDPTLWWFIASINGLTSNNIVPGTQLRVPRRPTGAVLR